MQTSALFRSIVSAGIVLWAVTPCPLHAADLTSEEARQIATDAYIYGYSLMTSDVTREAFINVKAPDPDLPSAVEPVLSMPKYPPADYKGVTAPNADTLYSGAFLDVSKEPIVLSYPDMHGRYFLFPIYSQWTNVIAAPVNEPWAQARRPSPSPAPMARDVAPGITQKVKSPTNSVFIIGRVYAEGTPRITRQ